MGFLKDFLFGKFHKHEETEEEDWDEVAFHREEVDFSKEEDRSSYVTGCLEQMEEASREIDLLTGEYTLVTAYLTDMEEIEALPDHMRETVTELAVRLSGLEGEVSEYKEKKNRMSDLEYYTLLKNENEAEEGLRKIREGERYAVKIKKDLRRLDGERHAYEFRRSELEKQMNDGRGMVVIFLTAYAVCMGLLAVFQFALEMDSFIGYFLATAAIAIAVTVLCVRYMDADKERLRVSKAYNKLIVLQNRVKIRYVNNRQLLHYLYMKYNVKNGEHLDRIWKAYQQEKEERRQYSEAQAQSEIYQKQLVDTLASYRIQYPDRWIHQVPALLDKRDMVELRHGLILRRQALREQMEYNRGLAQTARDEILEVAKTYPTYAREILDMMDAYETKEN